MHPFIWLLIVVSAGLLLVVVSAAAIGRFLTRAVAIGCYPYQAIAIGSHVCCPVVIGSRRGQSPESRENSNADGSQNQRSGQRLQWNLARNPPCHGPGL